MNAKDCLSDAARTDIQARIAAIESASSAEVVCAVATESGRYDRAESIVGLLAALLALSLGHLFYNLDTTPDPGSWVEVRFLPLAVQAILVVVGFVLGSFLGTYWHALRRLLVSKRELARETERAAHYLFASQRLRSTRDSGGVLVYVSLFERQIQILVDDGALAALPAERLEQLTGQMTSLLKSGDTRGAFLAVLDDIAEPLATALPTDDPDNENEIPDQVLLLHPRP